ncbi:MAG: cytochrome c [Cyclobacteriaceae bacterium]|jgi:mono/diheme cytochrome c family protein|uniref:Cytochrome C oxidase, cbb3-type, subunit III n=2 Tax=Arenibacter algicola TaxID=616991 RepID=A0A221UXC2_9FLAO|nr:cytochrome C oxidase, cbb3-type, subunit III [Arenibacter algicola]|tara:strand:- start:13466 stop:13873 length:408 start_codon:yes stop_codon:yes gene_type:complete
MKNKKFLPRAVAMAAIGFLFVGFNTQAQEKWVAPASADKIVNPLKGDANAADSGKRTYKMLCVVCHGAKGKGDGVGGAGLKPKPTDFTSAEVQAQTDGALFWKLEEGRSPMASYKTAIPEKKRWEIINYIRTLKK